MSKKLRVGIVGANATQSWAKYSHLPALHTLSDFDLTAVATRSKDSADATARAFNANHSFDDFNDLAKCDDVDIVTVCVKVPAHRDVVLAALKAGKHVYCEWPLAKSVAEAEELAAAAKQSKSHVVIGVQGRANPGVAQVKKILASGRIGTILSARMFSASSGFGGQFPSAYKYFDDPQSGANATTIMGGHALDLCIEVLGPVKEVQALEQIQFPTVTVVDTQEQFKRTVPDHVLMLLTFSSNVVANIEISGGQGVDAPFVFEINGTEGKIELRGGSMFGFQGGDLKLFINGAEEGRNDANDLDGAALNVGELYKQFGADIHSGKFTVPDFEYALSLTRLIEKVQLAARSGMKQPVE